MHWEWTRNLYWTADAITVLRDGEPDRVAALAAKSAMRAQLAGVLAALAAIRPRAGRGRSDSSTGLRRATFFRSRADRIRNAG
jgi:hypothetical protein